MTEYYSTDKTIKKGNFSLFIKTLKYVILNYYVQIQECYMFALLLKF